MIGYIKGMLITQRRGELWVDVNGVGYRVRTQNSKLKTQNGEEVELFIHTAVREDAITLYGFEDMETLELFELLIDVSGVGPKTAMEIVGAAPIAEIESAIAQANVAFFAQIKGIGKKSAQRIIIDLKSKIGSLKEVDLSAEDEDDVVFQALKQFGFKSGEVQTALRKIDRTKKDQDQIREGLRLLGKARV
jgi:Holliday junction DNA helicase RuvA